MAVSLAFETALFLLLATACSPSGKPAAPHRSHTAASSPPVPRGTLRVTGGAAHGSAGQAAGLSWQPSRLPHGARLLSYEVGYVWEACTALSRGGGRHCAGCPGRAPWTPARCGRKESGSGKGAGDE
jgi:hypothetical protein